MSDEDIREKSNPNEKQIYLEPEETTETVSPAESNDKVTTDEASALRTEVENLQEQLLRKAAEFENFKRRTREEKDAIIKYGTENLILNLLPVIDDFERSLEAGKQHPDFTSFYTGVEIIFGKLMHALAQRGLTQMAAEGQPFNEDFHDALMQVPTSEVQAGTVLDVAEKGYLLHDKVIRHAKVTVAIDKPDNGHEG